MNISDIQTLYAYNRWANHRMFSVLEKLSEEQFTAVHPSSFPSIQESVLHIFGAEWLWLKRWKGISPRATGPYSTSTLRDTTSNYGVETGELSTVIGLRSFSESTGQEWHEFLHTLTDHVLQAPLKFTDMAGNEHSAVLAHLMQHVVNHGTYHRGQVTTLLRQTGAETISLDMLYFFRELEPSATTAAR